MSVRVMFLPPLYEVLEKWSSDKLRSVNAQIEYLLTEAARKIGRWKKDTKRNKKDTQTQNKSDD
ncbi:MAG: hypothetical protein V7K47_29895 [Nostoc sp.]